MRKLGSESLLESISPTFRAFKQTAWLRRSMRASIEADRSRVTTEAVIPGGAQNSKELRVKDVHYLLSLRTLLVELSKKIDDFVLAETFIPAQFFSMPLNLDKLVWQVDEFQSAIDNPRADWLLQHCIKDGVDPFVRRQATLRGDLVTLSKKIRNLAVITHDAELESFYVKVVGFIAMLSEEKGVPISELLSDKDKESGGGNSGNGSSHGGGEFPGPDPKLMSSNRSMPWHQPLVLPFCAPLSSAG